MVSKDFDSTLSDAIDRAAGAANTAGATAARNRGRERTMRKRIVISTTSIVLVAAGAGAAFAVSSHNGGTPHPTAASPSVSAGPSTGASTSPNSTPTRSVSGAQSATASPSAPRSSSSTTSVTTGFEVWLTPSQLIYDSTMKWLASSPTSCTAGSFEITSLYPGGCSEHTNSGDPYPAEQMDTRVFSAPGVAMGNGAWAGTTADQEFYSYANAADAQSAYQYFTHAILTEDSHFAGSGDANTHLAVTSTTTETAQASGAMAIDSKLRASDGTPAELEGNSSEASDRHYFFAVRGDIVEMILVKGGPAVSDTSNDASYLQTVINALN